MERMVFGSTPKKLPKFVSKEVIEQMLDNARHDKDKHSTRNHLIMLFLWHTGVRGAECIKLRKRDVLSDSIMVRGGKGGKDRTVPIDPELSGLLRMYTDTMKADDTVFPITSRQLRNIIYKYRVSGYDIHPHTFRHSFAVYCLNQGMNIKALQRILGHGGLNTTSIYLDLVGSDIKESYAKVDWRVSQ